MPLSLVIDETLANAMFDAGRTGFELAGLKVEATGVSRSVAPPPSGVSGLIGVVGRVNGTISVGMSERLALEAAGSMLQQPVSSFDDDTLDALGEITNVIGGRLKSSLASSGYPLDHITLPAIVIGEQYRLAQARGMSLWSVSFLAPGRASRDFSERNIHVSMSLLASDFKRS
jgi:CheY-specific phosphatase CheX